MRYLRWIRRSAAGFALLFLASCSIDRAAIRMVSETLTAGGSTQVFTGDDDPALVGKALPFVLKLYEVLIAKDPENAQLLATTGQLFVVYANAYLQQPAEMLPQSAYAEQKDMLGRAKLLYLRGRDYSMKALFLGHPGFTVGMPSDALKSSLAKMTKGDVPSLFWAAAGWAGAYAINPFDFSLSVTIAQPIAMMNRALELDPTYEDGAIPTFFISYYAAAPSSLGGSLQKAKESFSMAIAISRGESPAPYVAYAQGIAVREHNRVDYVAMLQTALSIDPNADPANRLQTIVTQKKAKWLLDHADDYFLSP